MSSSLEPRHVRMLAVFVMSIGFFLFLSMIYIALSNAGVPTGVAFKMFVVGLIAGAVIATFGAILFRFPKLGEFGSS